MPPPTTAELKALLKVITDRVARHRERRGLLVRDTESSHLTRAPSEDAALEILQGHSITYRIAVGPQEGRKAFTLQTVPPPTEQPSKPFLASHTGFSLHAGVAVRGGDRKTLENLCQYITRPVLAEGRLPLTPHGRAALRQCRRAGRETGGQGEFSGVSSGRRAAARAPGSAGPRGRSAPPIPGPLRYVLC